MPHFAGALRPIEWRYTNDPAWVMRDKGERLGHNRVWMTAKGEMPDDPVIHAAALVYSSDTTVLDSIITTHGLSWGFDRIFAVTMNHSVWFHRPVRFDEWVLYSTTSPVAAESRGLGTGHFFDRDGPLLATVVQEGIVKYFPGRYGVACVTQNAPRPAREPSAHASTARWSCRRADAVQVVGAADLVKRPNQIATNDATTTANAPDATIPAMATPPLVASPRLTRPRPRNPRTIAPTPSGLRRPPPRDQAHDREDQRGDAETVRRGRRRGDSRRSAVAAER